MSLGSFSLPPRPPRQRPTEQTEVPRVPSRARDQRPPHPLRRRRDVGRVHEARFCHRHHLPVSGAERMMAGSFKKVAETVLAARGGCRFLRVGSFPPQRRLRSRILEPDHFRGGPLYSWAAASRCLDGRSMSLSSVCLAPEGNRRAVQRRSPWPDPPRCPR